MATWDERGYRHSRRRRLNKHWKHRDRWKPKGGGFMDDWRHRHNEPDWTFNRRKSAPETGFGVAYEDNPDADKY